MAEPRSWGGYPEARHARLEQPASRFAALPAGPHSLLAHGHGRSYGDVCLNDGGTLLLTRGLDRFIDFDEQTGILRCEAGVTLDSIIRLGLPHGWFLPVVPGTSQVSVGGAIANDVHGKNHLRMGSFGHHLRAFELLRSDGSRLLCSPQSNPEWFAASIGGLGLTGMITWAELGLRPAGSPWLDSETLRFGDLEEYFALVEACAATHEYRVAWFDCASTGRALGRGVLMRANHADGASRKPTPHVRNWTLPATPPLSLINRWSLKLFNSGYWHRQPSAIHRESSHYQRWFFPLDAIAHWNRLYGPHGFLQFQCVLPADSSRRAIGELLGRVSASGAGSFLAVLKQFGERPSRGLLSFPRPGTTLALDFPNQGKATLALFKSLADLVAEHRGAIYPAKDACMSGQHFRRAYPEWERFAQRVDPKFSSGFWRRVME